MWSRRFILIGILALPALAPASGIDCSKASTGVDHAICSDPQWLALDAEMAQAFDDALHRAGAARGNVLMDQREWVASRNQRVLSVINASTPDDTSSDEAVQQRKRTVTEAYASRIAFLKQLFVTQSLASELLKAIDKKLSSSGDAPAGGDYAYANRWIALGGDGSVFQIPKEERFAAMEVGRHIPADGSDTLTRIINNVAPGGTDAYVTTALLPDQHVGGIYTVSGTLDCTDWALFGWQGRVVHTIETPHVLDGNCWTSAGTILTFAGNIYAISDWTSLTSSDITVQALQGDKWGSISRLSVRYQTMLKPPIAYCDISSASCADLTQHIGELVTHYDHAQLPEVFSNNLSDAESARFRTMQEQAKRNAAVGDLPTFGRTLSNDYSAFEDDAVLFPLRWKGDLLLGKISHPTLGWRVDDDWIVGVWRWDGAAFVPIAGVIVPVQRGRYLTSAFGPKG